MDQSVEEINEQGSYQPPDTHDINWKHRSRSPETSWPRRDIGTMLLIGDTSMIVILTDQMVAIVIN